MIGSIVVGSTYTWSPTIYKDGVAYDLTGAVVTIAFRNPSGTVFVFPMTVTDAIHGKATYTNATTLFTLASGRWYRSYKVVQSGIVLESAGIRFPVYESISAS